MADINNVTVIGRLVSTPDLKYTKTGTAMLRLSIANNTGFGDKQYTNFIDCTYWGKGAEAVSKYLAKGKQIAIQGELRQNTWEQDGQKRSKLEINVTYLQLLGGKTEGTDKVKKVFQGDETFTDDIPF